MLGVLGALLLGTLILFGFGQALGARGHAQRAADLAAVSAAQVMRRDFGRLFEPPVLEGGLPNRRHLTTAAYLSLARAAALRGARRNGVDPRRVRVAFPSTRFAPTQITVAVAERVEVKLSGKRSRPVAVQAKATAAITPANGLALPTQAAGGGYSGPLAYRQGKPMRPDGGGRLRPHRRSRPCRDGAPAAGHLRLPLRRRAGAAVRGSAHASIVFRAVEPHLPRPSRRPS